MIDERDEFEPYWLQTATTRGSQLQPSNVPPTGPWPFPRINTALINAIDWSKVPIPPAPAPWFPSATPVPAIRHAASARYWGAGPTDRAPAPPLSNGGILGVLVQPQHGTAMDMPEPARQDRDVFDAADSAKSLGIGLTGAAINTLGARGDLRETIARGVQKATDYFAPGYGEWAGSTVSRGLSGNYQFSGPTSSDI